MMLELAALGAGLLLVAAEIVRRRRKRRRRPLFLPGDRIVVGGRGAIVESWSEERQKLVYKWVDEGSAAPARSAESPEEVEPDWPAGP